MITSDDLTNRIVKSSELEDRHPSGGLLYRILAEIKRVDRTTPRSCTYAHLAEHFEIPRSNLRRCLTELSRDALIVSRNEPVVPVPVAYQKTLSRKRIRQRANQALHEAVSDGRVAKPANCQRCGLATARNSLHGHHYDYSKPLAVYWLCKDCHYEAHRSR
jgi:hypothetical protein